MIREIRERGIVFGSDMVRAILESRNGAPRRKLYPPKGGDPLSPEHLARRLANGLDDIPQDGCWEWTRAKPHGYGTLTVGRKTRSAHRLAYQLGVGPIPRRAHIRHSCDNPSCINPDHLFAGTREDNMQDCVRRGRHGGPPPARKGEKNPASKLTSDKVDEIRRQLTQGSTQTKIARRFGISQSQVSNIKIGRQWR